MRHTSAKYSRLEGGSHRLLPHNGGEGIRPILTGRDYILFRHILQDYNKKAYSLLSVSSAKRCILIMASWLCSSSHISSASATLRTITEILPEKIPSLQVM